MDISTLLTHSKQVKGDTLREMDKDKKKDKTGNYEYSQLKYGSGNRSHFQQRSIAPSR